MEYRHQGNIEKEFRQLYTKINLLLEKIRILEEMLKELKGKVESLEDK